MPSVPLAYFRGRFVPAHEAVLPVDDLGFVLGVTVAERLRTFGGRLFRVEQHLARLKRSLEIVGIDAGGHDLDSVARELVAHNHPLLPAGHDLGVVIFVTPGTPADGSHSASGPTVCVHSAPLAFSQWARLYDEGQALVVPPVTQVPSSCWPAELKCRSRMHYYLADRAARQIDPQARALLLDTDGYVTEASTANLVIYEARHGLVSPPQVSILPGISVAMLADLARQEGIAFGERLLRADDIYRADEVMLCSTSPCVWPVTRCDGRPIGNGQPGPVFRRLLQAWGEAVGLDIAGQARRHC